MLLKDSTGVSSYTFSIDGEQLGAPTSLTTDEINKFNVQNLTDLENSGSTGTRIESEVFNPSSDGGTYNFANSQTRYLYSSSAGILISKNSLTVGSDLGNQASVYSSSGTEGPDRVLVSNADLNLTTEESVVGVRRVIQGDSNTGFDLIIADQGNTSQKRILTVDNNGDPISTGANKTIDSTAISTRMYELQTGLDLNNDGLKTFNIDGASSSLSVDFSNRGSNNETGRYTRITTDGLIILTREQVPQDRWIQIHIQRLHVLIHGKAQD